MKIATFLQRLACFTLLVLLAGCAAQMNKMMASWEGRTVADLVGKWGSPTSTINDGHGGQILTYKRTITLREASTQTTGTVSKGGNIDAKTVATPPETATTERIFYVNERGIIYRWAWR